MSAETASLDGAESGGIDLFGAAVTLGSTWITSKNDVRRAATAARAAVQISESERQAREDMIKVGIGLILLIIVGTVAYKKLA